MIIDMREKNKTRIRPTKKAETDLWKLIRKQGFVSQAELQLKIWEETGELINKARLSRLIGGKQRDMMGSTMVVFAKILGVTMDELAEAIGPKNENKDA